MQAKYPNTITLLFNLSTTSFIFSNGARSRLDSRPSVYLGGSLYPSSPQTQSHSDWLATVSALRFRANPVRTLVWALLL